MPAESHVAIKSKKTITFLNREINGDGNKFFDVKQSGIKIM